MILWGGPVYQPDQPPTRPRLTWQTLNRDTRISQVRLEARQGIGEALCGCRQAVPRPGSLVDSGIKALEQLPGCALPRGLVSHELIDRGRYRRRLERDVARLLPVLVVGIDKLP